MRINTLIINFLTGLLMLWGYFFIHRHLHIDRSAKKPRSVVLETLHFFKHATLRKINYLYHISIKAPLPRNISFLKSSEYGLQECAQTQALLAAVLLMTGTIWMHEYDFQHSAFHIARNLNLWSQVEIQCHHVKLWWSILII